MGDGGVFRAHNLYFLDREFGLPLYRFTQQSFGYWEVQKEVEKLTLAFHHSMLVFPEQLF